MVLCIRDAFYESRSLEVERKAGGNFHPRLLISVKPIANKYHEGNVRKALVGAVDDSVHVHMANVHTAHVHTPHAYTAA